MVDRLIVDVMESAGIDIVVSLPCNMLTGILSEIDTRLSIQHITVCREEEGVGIAAGAALAGRKPALLMQNSGLGNCINALMSLTALYHLPLFMLMSHRGGQGEKISAQIPMGKAAPLLLDTLKIDYLSVTAQADLENLKTFIKETYNSSLLQAAFITGELWDEAR